MSFIVKGIDLPKKDGEIIKIALYNRNGKVEAYSNLQKIGEAIQIPKGHGRLKDDKEILARAEQEVDGLVMSAEHLPMVIEWILDKCDTILEAEE